MEVIWSTLTGLFQDWMTLDFVPRCAVAIIVLAVPPVWLYETVRHAAMIGRKGIIHLAPISVRGRILEELGPGGAASALQSELLSIREALSMLDHRPAPYIAPATGRDTGYYLVGLRREVEITLGEQHEPTPIDQEIVLRLGTVTIPISSFVNFLVAILGAFPVPFRRRYRQARIQVSMVAVGDQTRLTVELPGEYAGRLSRGPFRRSASSPVTLAEVRITKTLEDVSDMIRDAAFMILKLHSADEMNWRSLRNLTDGLVALEEYRRTGSEGSRQKARSSFRLAATDDPSRNYHALYFHGVMTMVERTAESIEEASQYFHRALQTEQHQLRALVHTGLAYCYGQRFHRLGKRSHDILEKAQAHALEARNEWLTYLRKERGTSSGSGAQRSGMHPVIPYTLAIVTTVDETGPHRLQRFLSAVKLYCEAIALEPDNGMFYNNLGWALLKLIELEEAEELPSDLELPDGDPERNIALLCEKYLRHALGLNPRNKLAHSNLCLLYSTQHFRDDGNHFVRCRYHGLKALELDPDYINGQRDIAVAFLRYHEFEQAKAHYLAALRLAEDPDKDEEVIEDVVRELRAALERMGKSEGRIDKIASEWMTPDSTLLIPRSALPKEAEQETEN